MDGAYHILVVEPCEASRAQLTEMLSDGPYRVDPVPDAETALARLGQDTFHLVLTDVALPGMSGMRFLAEVRTHHPRLPVILATARADAATAIEALRLGATNFLPKPIDRAELTAIVRKTLRPWAINAGKKRAIPALTKRLEMELLSSTEVIDPVFYHVYADALSLGFPEPVLRLNVYLALNEALANAVRHGNKLDPAKRVRVEAELTSDSLRLVVRDEGEGFVPEELPDPTSPENLLRTNGRGVFLMRCYMDEVEYRDGGRTLVLTKRASAEGLNEQAAAELDAGAEPG